MYIYFDKNGTLKEIVADIPARRGSNDYNKIYVYLEGKTPNDISDIWYKQQFPDGTQSIEVSIKTNTVTKAIPYDKNVDMKFFQDYVEYPFYYINLNSSYLAQNGLNLGTIRVVIGDEIFALGMITFNVETNVVVKDTDISQSQYDYFITKMNTKVDKQSSDGDFQATISNEDGIINLESKENDEKSIINLEGSTGSMSARYDVDHRGYIAFAGGNVSLYSLVGDYENEIYMSETEFYLQRKDAQDNLVIHKIDLVNGTIDGRAFDYSDVKHYQITSYTSGSTDYNFTQSGIDTTNLVAFRLIFNTVDANKELKINNKNVRLSTNPTSNATMGMLKSFKEDGANVYDFYAFYNGTYFYVINQNMYDKDVTMTHITLGSLTGTLSTSIQQSISYNGIETMFNITAFSGLLPILFRPYQISSGVYSYRSITPLEDADGSYYYEGTINLNDGTYNLSTKTYVTVSSSANYELQPTDITIVGAGIITGSYEVTLSQDFIDVIEEGKKPIWVSATLMSALTEGDITSPMLFNNIATDLYNNILRADHSYIYSNISMGLGIVSINATIYKVNDKYYFLRTNSGVDPDDFVAKSSFQIADLGNNQIEIYYDGNTYTAGGGTFYQHNLVLRGTTLGYFCVSITNRSSTPFTYNDLVGFLYNNGFTSVDNPYTASGIAISGGNVYSLIGVRATTSSVMSMVIYTTSFTSINVSNMYFISDTVVEI